MVIWIIATSGLQWILETLSGSFFFFPYDRTVQLADIKSLCDVIGSSWLPSFSRCLPSLRDGGLTPGAGGITPSFTTIGRQIIHCSGR